MEITHLSDKAFATLVICEKTKQPFGVTVDPVGGKLKLVWAFKIDKEKAHREHFDATHVRGSIFLDKNFPGCPYCGSKEFVICGNCGANSCYHGQRMWTCPSCGNVGEVISVDSIDLEGGGF